jgi:hypothetical protein
VPLIASGKPRRINAGRPTHPRWMARQRVRRRQRLHVSLVESARDSSIS